MVKGKDSGRILQENSFDRLLKRYADSRPIRIATTLVALASIGLAHINRPPIAEATNETTATNSSDIIPTQFTACYRPVSGDPSSVEFIVTAKEKNNGTATTGKVSRTSINIDTLGDSTPETNFDVPVLAAGQEYTVISSGVVATRPATSVSGSNQAMGVFRTDDYWTPDENVIESNEGNNDVNMFPVPQCEPAPVVQAVTFHFPIVISSSKQ